MDAAAFEQVYGSFRDFHAYFAPLFGRRETREHSGHYLQALLVQSGERRNAENLSETVPGSARGMQRFLTDSPWDDEVIIGRLQEYLETRLEHPEGVWVLDGSDFPKQGRKSVGVARQYCGRLGKVANCQAGMFLAYVSPLGRALVDKGLYLPESWTSDKDRCEAAGVPEDRQGYRSKTELASSGRLVAALLHGPALTVSQPGFAGTPESLILRTGPGRLRRPHHKARRNVQHVPHPQGRQALPEGRRHPEGVVRRDPSSLQVAPLHVPAPPSPRPTPSWTGSPAYPPAHPPPHTGLCPRSNSRADIPLSTNARPNGLT